MTPVAVPGALSGDYAVDIARTRIGFVARHTIGSEAYGRFGEFEGSAPCRAEGRRAAGYRFGCCRPES